MRRINQNPEVRDIIAIEKLLDRTVDPVLRNVVVGLLRKLSNPLYTNSNAVRGAHPLGIDNMVIGG